MSVLLVALGGALGSVARYWMGGAVNRATHFFPAGTFVVNVAGSLLIGLLTGMLMNDQTDQQIRPALIVGFCGGFTTFSTFSMETVAMFTGGEVVKATVYALSSVVVCVCGAALGFVIGRPTAG